MSDRDLAAEYADVMVESIAEIMARYSGEEHDDECESTEWPTTGELSCSCPERASEELTESYALELVSEVGEPFSALLTYGGPTAWVEWTARGGTANAVLMVTWGSGMPEKRYTGAIRALAAFYAEYMDV